MTKAIIQMNQLDYVAAFSRPALSLWGDGARILQGLYDSFHGLHQGLNDITVEGDPAHPARQSVTVAIKPNAYYRFRFDRVEAQMVNFSDAHIATLPDILARGDRWLREAIPSLAFQSHVLSYSSHSRLEGAKSSNVLASLTRTNFPMLGESAGAGIIYRSELPTRGWRTQLTIDHSLVVPDGLFVYFEVLVNADQIDYGEALTFARHLLDGAIDSIGVRFEGEDKS
ncbi:MAG TPA: hypothetical protein VF118_17520 [Gemmatimonadaceae bacterium]